MKVCEACGQTVWEDGEGPLVYSIDEAVERAHPRIELRKKLYKVADLKPGEEIRAMREIGEMEGKLLRLTSDGTADDELQRVSGEIMAAFCKRVLKGVPVAVGRTLTILEFKGLSSALGALQGAQVPPVQKKRSAETPTTSS